MKATIRLAMKVPVLFDGMAEAIFILLSRSWAASTARLPDPSSSPGKHRSMWISWAPPAALPAAVCGSSFPLPRTQCLHQLRYGT